MNQNTGFSTYQLCVFSCASINYLELRFRYLENRAVTIWFSPLGREFIKVIYEQHLMCSNVACIYNIRMYGTWSVYGVTTYHQLDLKGKNVGRRKMVHELAISRLSGAVTLQVWLSNLWRVRNLFGSRFGGPRLEGRIASEPCAVPSLRESRTRGCEQEGWAWVAGFTSCQLALVISNPVSREQHQPDDFLKVPPPLNTVTPGNQISTRVLE